MMGVLTESKSPHFPQPKRHFSAKRTRCLFLAVNGKQEFLGKQLIESRLPKTTCVEPAMPGLNQTFFGAQSFDIYYDGKRAFMLSQWQGCAEVSGRAFKETNRTPIEVYREHFVFQSFPTDYAIIIVTECQHLIVVSGI